MELAWEMVSGREESLGGVLEILLVAQLAGMWAFELGFYSESRWACLSVSVKVAQWVALWVVESACGSVLTRARCWAWAMEHKSANETTSVTEKGPI